MVKRYFYKLPELSYDERSAWVDDFDETPMDDIHPLAERFVRERLDNPEDFDGVSVLIKIKRNGDAEKWHSYRVEVRCTTTFHARNWHRTAPIATPGRRRTRRHD
jgi:hypothetical protein